MRVFFQEYEPTWRLTKLLTIKLNLEERGKLQTYLKSYYNNELPTDDYVYRVTSNGLLFSALAETFMAIEDFFVLFRFIREEEYFVQKIVTYSAGTIKNVINKAGGLSMENSLKALLIPSADFVGGAIARAASTAEDFREERYEFLEQHKVACANTVQSLQKVIEFFKKYETRGGPHP